MSLRQHDNRSSVIATEVNAAGRGDRLVVGTVTLTPSAASTQVADKRVRQGHYIAIFPMTATAWAAFIAGNASVIDADVVDYGFTVRHNSNAATDRQFWYWCVWGGRPLT